jgi:hypothetical protein
MGMRVFEASGFELWGFFYQLALLAHPELKKDDCCVD